MNQLRAILDKVDSLLTTEPARLIGYGAAVIVFLAVEFLNSRGITRFGTDLTFEQAIGLVFGVIGLLVAAVEAIRKFVYSPQTFIEQLSDEFQNGHDTAHFEELVQAVRAQRAAVQQANAEAQTQKIAIPVGTIPPVDPDKQN